MQIRAKLSLLFGTITASFLIIACIAVGLIAYKMGQEIIQEQAENHLTSIRDIKKDQIERYYSTLKRQVQALSNDRMIITAMEEFKQAYKGFPQLTENGHQPQELQRYYQQEFGRQFDRLNPEERINTDRLLTSLSPQALALQQSYIALNPNPLGEKDKLLNAGDGSQYSQLHQEYHPHISDFLQKFSYYDIFLIDDLTGNIVYSVFKELDFATSLIDGPYADSGIAEAFRAANKTGNRDLTVISNFKPYLPSYMGPAAFIASPIYQGTQKIGVLIFQAPIDEINAIMTFNHNWASSGLGNSGEAYLIDESQKMQSVSRFLLEDKPAYLAALSSSGVSPKEVSAIDTKNTSIGLQKVNSPGVRAALAGEHGFATFPDYRNVEVLSAYAPLDIEGVELAILSEIDVAEAFASQSVLASNISTWSLVIILLLVSVSSLIGWIVAGQITKPINTVVNSLNQIAEAGGDLTQRIDSTRRDETGRLAVGFNGFVSKIHTVISDVADNTKALSDTANSLSVITQQASSGAIDQQSNSDVMAAAMAEMSVTIKEVSHNTQQALDAVHAAESKAEIGKVEVKHTISMMTELSTQVGVTSIALTQVVKQSQQITSLLNIINDMAEQTNLLALNAAIEAARAGDHGRGFSVVADEVRSLASRVQSSTEDIRDVVAKLNTSVTDANEAMLIGKDQSAQSLEQAEKAGAALEEITRSTMNIEDISTMIAAAMEQQSVATEEILRSITNISVVASQTATGSEQQANMSDNLRKMAEQLDFSIAKFTV